MKMKLKGCPRCGGDLMPDESDRDGVTYACLQCGAEFAAAGLLAPAPTTAAQAARAIRRAA